MKTETPAPLPPIREILGDILLGWIVDKTLDQANRAVDRATAKKEEAGHGNV